MRNLFAIALLCPLFVDPSVAKAQEKPIVELYGGYDYVRYNANPKISGLPPSESFNANGLGNSGGGKEPQLKGNARSNEGPRDWR